VSKDTTIFNFKKLPAGLLIAALLFITAECLVYLNRASFIKEFWNKFIINEHVLLDTHKDYEYLLIGDSIQKTGIKAVAVSDKLLSLGLPGGKPMSLYLLLDRYLKTHKPPKAIFLYVDPEPPHDSLFVILRFFVKIPEFISIWPDLTWKERQIFIMRYWASLDLRKVGLTKRDDYPYSNRKFIDELKKNQGYMPSPRSNISIGDRYFADNKGRYQEEVSFSENDLKYLDKFMNLASSKGIRVIFLGFLVPRELYDILEEKGFNSNYISFFNNLRKRYPQAYFDSNPILYLDNKFFGDPSHVNDLGSEFYTEYFKNQLFLSYLKRRALS
jgi:hypothetical protein